MGDNLQTREDVVRLVQKLYNTPLNPEVIQSVSSIMVVPLNSDVEPDVLDISDVGEFGSMLGGERSVSRSKAASSNVEDSIIFVQANCGSNPGNPNEASTLREELQSMASDEVSNWLQLTEDVDCAEIIMNSVEPDEKWKDCKKYQRKKTTAYNQQEAVERHLELLKMKKGLTVNPSYITLRNEGGALESADPMSRLVNVDESRSLMTQEYVSSVLSALDTDLSYSVFDREANLKAAEAAVAAPLSPRQRESDSPEPVAPLNRKPISKAGKRASTVPSSNIGVSTAPGPVLSGPSTASARFKIIQHRPTSPPALVPFQQNPQLRMKTSFVTIPGLQFPGVGIPKLCIDNPGTTISGLRIKNNGTAIHGLHIVNAGTTFPGQRIEDPATGLPEIRIENPRSISGVQSEYPAGDPSPTADDVSAGMEVDDEDYTDESEWRKLPKNLCRVCAKACAKLEYVFSEKGQSLNLAELVHTHLPIMITAEDLLPTHICTSCITRLQAADSLVRTCMEADTNLRGLLDVALNTPMGEIFDDGDNRQGDTNLSQDEDEDDMKPKPWDRKKDIKFSSLLSEDDVSLISKMKGDGLKVTLVRVPNLNDLPEEKKHQRVLQVLRSMNTTKSCKKKSVKTSAGGTHANPTIRETANISAVDSALQDLTAGSALHDNETSNISVPHRPRESESPKRSESAEATEAPTEAPTTSEPLAETPRPPPETPKATPETPKSPSNISFSADVPSLLKNELLHGISYAIKQGHVAKTGSIIKVNCKPDDNSSSPSSVYVYVRNKETPPNPQQLPRKILDLDVLHELQQHEKKQKEKKAAAKVAKQQASIIRRKARVREKRRIVKERKHVTCEECQTVFDTKEEMAEHRLEHLKCRFCEKQFSKKPSLVEHERVHTKEKPFICDQCGRAFRTRAQMTQHAQRHNTDTPYKCGVCGQEFAVRNTYQAHVTRHSTESPYLCEMCGKCFKVQVALRLHRLTHRSFNCNICDKVFSYRAYQIHKKSHAGDESKFPCTYCNKKFLTVHRLKIHMLIHEATYPFSCSVCKRSFKRMTHLQAHQNRHTPQQLEGVSFFCCAICQTQYEQPSQLSQHLKTHSDEERQALRSYKCDTCNRCFSIERELRSHEIRHAGKQTFSCGICDKAFDTKKEFDEHSDEHTEEKPFACEVCRKRFRALLNLNNHQQIHLSFKPYPCQSCPKAFKTINGLNQHKVVHSDIRKHTCSICSMGFKRRDAMKNHERTHFAERPYACSVCGRAFKVKADCSTHLKRHREAGIEGSIMESCYTCPVCSATFSLKVELSTHVNNAHQLEVAVLDKDDNLVLVPEVEIF